VKLLALALAALLAACATPETEAVLAPNSNLLAQGIPPIPMSLIERVARYADFRGHSFVEWHPVKTEMLIAHRKAGDNTPQIYRLAQPMVTPEQLTEGSDPVTNATWEPREGRYVVFERSQGGDEADQLYRLDLPSRRSTLLTNPQEAHNIVGWIRTSSTLLYTAVPLDRTAQGGTRATINTTLWAIDPTQPETSRRKVAELPGPGWFGGGVSDDGKQVAIVRYRSAAESQVWLVDSASGQSKQVLPAPNESIRATHFFGGFAKDGKRLHVVSDRSGEFREAMNFDLASGAPTRVTGHIPWDVSGGAASDDGRWFVAQINADGRDELRLFDAVTAKEASAPKVPAGSIGNTMQFHRTTHQLAFSINSAKGPNELFALDPVSGRNVQWTRAQAAAGIDASTFAEQSIVRWKSFDGLAISGLLTSPPKRFSGKRPVIVSIHGGPEAQATMNFQGRWNYFIQELGIALIERQRARLVGLRQDLLDARQRHEARRLGQGHRRAVGLDSAAARSGCAACARARRQLWRLHDAGQRGALQRPHRRRHPGRRHLQLRQLSHQHRELSPRSAACRVWR
jgi:Prolyl oligopeptidase, N-terminal beta-propeller domain